MPELRNQDALFETVATLFAVSVLADHRVRDAELVEFVHACSLHNLQIHPDTLLSRRDIIDWFNKQKAEIGRALEGPNADDYIVDLLSRIKEEGLQRSVLSSIFTISICDYELHDEESALISKALEVWNTTMPLPTEVEWVA
jgi:hypothetical protein